jgi:hypothetical protein
VLYEKYLGKKRAFLRRGSDTAANRPNPLSKPNPLALSIHHCHSGLRHRSGPPISLSFSVQALPVRSFSPNFSLTHAWPLRRWNPTAAAPSHHLLPLLWCPFACAHLLMPPCPPARSSRCLTLLHRHAHRRYHRR